jgi:hypothetical protein
VNVALGVCLEYVPWPETGCSLAEARRRGFDCGLGEQARAESKAETHCLDLLKGGRLIGYGSPDSSTAEPQLISKLQWASFCRVEWNASTACDGGEGGKSFSNIRIHPPLLAPCRIQHLAGLTLLEAFKQLVLGDAEVALLGRKAVRLSPDTASVFVGGRCQVYGDEDWPLAFDRWVMVSTVHPDPDKRSLYDGAGDPDPIEVVIAAEALKHRYRALISMLQRGELEGWGLPATPGHPDVIPRSVWSHEAFHFDARTGDILQDNPESTGRYDRRIRRWIGVMLRIPNIIWQRTQSTEPMFHGKPLAHDRLLPTTSEPEKTIARQSKAIARVATKNSSRKGCERWLKEIISHSPNQRTHSKEELWADAKQKWPDLSERQFLMARSDAITASSAFGWAASGRAKKTPR